jgi:hypothetical protein
MYGRGRISQSEPQAANEKAREIFEFEKFFGDFRALCKFNNLKRQKLADYESDFYIFHIIRDVQFRRFFRQYI